MVGGEELRDRKMEEEAETRTLQKWLQVVDKPLATKKADKKDAKRKRRGKQ